MVTRIRKQIGVIGAGACSEEVESHAEAVGREIARKGALLLCGGLGGVMEAASRGAKKEGGANPRGPSRNPERRCKSLDRRCYPERDGTRQERADSPVFGRPDSRGRGVRDSLGNFARPEDGKAGGRA